MAVNAEGYEFKYISDELYVNGKRVARAYADGKLVYPELIEYQFSIKAWVKSNHGMMLSDRFYYKIDDDDTEYRGYVLSSELQEPECWWTEFEIKAYSEYPLYYFDIMPSSRFLISYLPGTKKEAYSNTIIANITATYGIDASGINEFLKNQNSLRDANHHEAKILSADASRASDRTNGEIKFTTTNTGSRTSFKSISSVNDGRYATFGSNLWEGYYAGIHGSGFYVPATFLVYDSRAVGDDNPSGMVKANGRIYISPRWVLPDEMPFSYGGVINPSEIKYMNQSEYLASL